MRMEIICKLIEYSFGWLINPIFKIPFIFHANYGFYTYIIGEKDKFFCARCLNVYPPKAIPLPKEPSTCTWLQCPVCRQFCKNPEYQKPLIKGKNRKI